MNGNKTVELEQRRVELLRRDDESDGAPPRSSIDLTKGTAFIVLPQEADGPCADAPPTRASADDVEDLLLDAVGVRLVLDELQLLRVLVGVAEQPLARAEQQREDEQVVAVDQAGVGEARGRGWRCRG